MNKNTLKLLFSVFVMSSLFLFSCSDSEKKEEVKVEDKTDLQEGIGIQTSSSDIIAVDEIGGENIQEGAKPLVIADGKVVDMGSLKPDMIESMNVIKGEKAIEKYGDRGKNGVIEITLK